MMQGTGKYKARLFDAVRFQTLGGKDAVSFTWDLFEIGRRVTSTLTLLDSHGHPNVAAIYDAKQWARGWDGANLDWFAAQLNAHQVFEVYLDIMDGAVMWVFPSRRSGVGVNSSSGRKEDTLHSPTPTQNSNSSTPQTVKLVVDRDVLQRLPDSIEPNAVNAKTLFDAMTEKTERDDANTVWVMMAAEVGPMQLDFTPEQWQQMIDKIRNLETKTFTITERL